MDIRWENKIRTFYSLILCSLATKGIKRGISDKALETLLSPIPFVAPNSF